MARGRLRSAGGAEGRTDDGRRPPARHGSRPDAGPPGASPPSRLRQGYGGAGLCEENRQGSRETEEGWRPNVSIKPIEKPLDGERVLAISPETANAAAADWLRRPNLFPGRALTAPTLEQRQRWQAGRIAVRSQAFTRGAASGLEVSYTIEPAAPGARGIVRLQIIPGRALTWTGEDVVLATPVDVRFDD